MAGLFLAKCSIRTRLAGLCPRRRRPGINPAYLPYYSDRILSSPCNELADAARLLDPVGPDGIDLSQGSPRFDLAPSASTWLPAEHRRCPPVGLPELRAATADHLQAE